MNQFGRFKWLVSFSICLFVGCAGGDRHSAIVDCFGHVRSSLIKVNDQPIQWYQGQVLPILHSQANTTHVNLDFNIDRFPDCAERYSGSLTIRVKDPIPGILFSYAPSTLPAAGSGYQALRISMEIPATQPNGNISISLAAAETPSDYGYYTFNLMSN